MPASCSKGGKKKLFENAVPAQATVTRYDEYQSTTGPSGDGAPYHTMYTAVVSYRLADGSVIEAKEQAGRSRQKYAIGQMLDIEYSPQQPDFFVVRGDKSRAAAFIGMFFFGLAMVVLAALMYFKQ